MNEKLPLNSLHLKLLAVVTMLIDHMGFTLFPHAVWMRAVGRLAFPIFCFLIAEGCAHTHDKKRYAGRTPPSPWALSWARCAARTTAAGACCW